MGGASPSYKGHRYPVEVISHCVWLYHRFPLSFREVEELRLERGVVVSYETVRRWCVKFGPPCPHAPSGSHRANNVTTPSRAFDRQIRKLNQLSA
ncbi:hypothetical protein SMA5143A_4826 [Streptomyces sp. MA5143a]|nr:hypothetical protein SMA5143A_4826 [Streptomyces sp. MA5143a]